MAHRYLFACVTVLVFASSVETFAEGPRAQGPRVIQTNGVFVVIPQSFRSRSGRITWNVLRDGSFERVGNRRYFPRTRRIKLPNLAPGTYRVQLRSCAEGSCGRFSRPTTFTVEPTGEPGPNLSPSTSATATPMPTAAGTTQELNYNGITVQFSTPRPYGFYVTGEPWILGPATIVGVSPAPLYSFIEGTHTCIQSSQSIELNCTEHPGTACCSSSGRCLYQATRNGMQVNPVSGGPHAFDGRSCAYDHSTRATLPLALPANVISSVVLTASNPEDSECSLCSWCGPGWLDYDQDTNDCNWSPVKRGVVLTVVPTIPFSDELRPPYPGPAASKRTYRTNTLNMNFVSLPPPANGPSFQAVLRTIRNTWFVHTGAESYTTVSPTENMKSYGARISVLFGTAALSLVRSDFTPAEKREIALHLLQIGVDTAHAYWNGGEWNGAGGHGGVGRIAAIVLAGYLLGDAAILDIPAEASVTNAFGQLCHTYYDSPAEVNYMGINGFPRMDPYGHCPTPTALQSPPNIDTNATYFQCCTVTAWVGEVTALRLMGLEQYVRHSALFDVIDRVLFEGVNGSHGSAWNDGFWHTYVNNPALRPLLCQNGALNKCGGTCNSLTSPIQFSGESGIDCGPVCPPPRNVCQ